MPIDYQKGKIYTIRCYDDPSLIYVGSTCDTLWSRWGGHKKAMIQKPHIPLYKNMSDKGVDMFYIELYEECPSNSKEQLHQREGEITRQIGTVNKVIAGRNKKEYYQENKAKILQQRQEYRIDNREEVLEKDKRNYAKNREQILDQRKVYYEKNKEVVLEKKKEYYINKKEVVSQKKKEFYKKNRDVLLSKMKEKITCNHCGALIARVNLERHKRSQKCINYVPSATLDVDDAFSF